MCTIFKLNLSCIQYCGLVNFDLFMLKAFECYCECYNWYVSWHNAPVIWHLWHWLFLSAREICESRHWSAKGSAPVRTSGHWKNPVCTCCRQSHRRLLHTCHWFRAGAKVCRRGLFFFFRNSVLRHFTIFSSFCEIYCCDVPSVFWNCLLSKQPVKYCTISLYRFCFRDFLGIFS